jgi:hypothetical protein
MKSSARWEIDAMRDTSPIDALKEYLDRWAAAHSSCEPADRGTAEEGIRLAYASAGLAPPQRIIWCGGPLEIAQHLAAASADDLIGANVKAEVFDRVRDRVGTFAEVFWKEVLVAATQLTDRKSIGAAVDDYNRCKAVSAAVNRLVRDAADESLFGLRLRARHAALRLRGGPRLLPRSGFDEVAVGPHDVASLGVYEYLHDILAWQEPTQPMQGLWKIAKSAGWIVPHEHVCWISERPSILRTDARARLHGADSPALQYRDGWSAYAWKGVQVPAWTIEHPERVTRSDLANTFDPVLRNCLIEIMTPERFIESGGPARVSQDDTGVLWRKLWGYRGVTIGSWTAVEVVNGTAESDGSRKRYVLRVPSRMRSAREAVAWTYGLTAEQYAGLELRT